MGRVTFPLLVVTVVENKVTHATKFIALRIALAYTESGNQKIVFSFVFIFVTNFWDSGGESVFFYIFSTRINHINHTQVDDRASSLSAADDVVDSSGSHSDDDDDRDDKLDTQTQARSVVVATSVVAETRRQSPSLSPDHSCTRPARVCRHRV